jgi:hypothetical protein
MWKKVSKMWPTTVIKTSQTNQLLNRQKFALFGHPVSRRNEL